MLYLIQIVGIWLSDKTIYYQSKVLFVSWKVYQWNNDSCLSLISTCRATRNCDAQNSGKHTSLFASQHKLHCQKFNCTALQIVKRNQSQGFQSLHNKFIFICFIFNLFFWKFSKIPFGVEIPKQICSVLWHIYTCEDLSQKCQWQR